ncbi:MAG: tetratricopeptide repeat protein [Bacteroides sp.]|nr:tetratricopeptide repeat protein [Prevotella sp.]MCM1408835.1 tetratricopeptide repeat protein [Treponema brennaborense]MCM1470615.1 tetratricopeptide repeat protein [Bacteroides sp.]
MNVETKSGKFLSACAAALLSCAVCFSAEDNSKAAPVYTQARQLELSGKTAEAAKVYQQSADIARGEIAADSKNADAYSVLGWALLRLQRYAEAERISREGLKSAPNDVRIIETLGEACFYTDKYTDSLAFFERYFVLAPNGNRVSTAYFFVGEIYRLTGKTEHADIAYCTALKKSPYVSLWWYRLGVLRAGAGKDKDAKYAFEQALKLRPDYPEAAAALKKLS